MAILQKVYSNTGLYFLEAENFSTVTEWIEKYVSDKKDDYTWQVEILRSGAFRLSIKAEIGKLRNLWKDLNIYNNETFSEESFQSMLKE